MTQGWYINPTRLIMGTFIFIIKIFVFLSVFSKGRLWRRGSRHLRAQGWILSKRTRNSMMGVVEFLLIHGFLVKLWRSKRGPGTQSGGWPPETPSGRRAPGPGGECFAPLSSRSPGDQHIAANSSLFNEKFTHIYVLLSYNFDVENVDFWWFMKLMKEHPGMLKNILEYL